MGRLAVCPSGRFCALLAALWGYFLRRLSLNLSVVIICLIAAIARLGATRDASGVRLCAPTSIRLATSSAIALLVIALRCLLARYAAALLICAPLDCAPCVSLSRGAPRSLTALLLRNTPPLAYMPRHHLRLWAQLRCAHGATSTAAGAARLQPLRRLLSPLSRLAAR